MFLVLVPVAASQFQVQECYLSACIPGWTRFGDHCYLYVDSELKFGDAEAYCQRFSDANRMGHLVSVHSAQEMEFVTTLIRASGGKGNFWIGLTDSRREGEPL